MSEPAAAREAPAKNDLSYTYWHGKGGGDAPVKEPQRLSAEELAALEAQQRTCAAASAWNAAGTWEERNWTSWAQARLTELVTGLRAPLPGGGELRTSGVATCTGDAMVTTVRGRLRHGFDFDVAVSWTATLPAAATSAAAEPREVKGTLQLPEASRDAAQSGELELEVRPDRATLKKAAASDAESRALTAAAKALHAPLLAAVRQLDADMAARANSA